MRFHQVARRTQNDGVKRRRLDFRYPEARPTMLFAAQTFILGLLETASTNVGPAAGRTTKLRSD
jgi:hypothetical protein